MFVYKMTDGLMEDCPEMIVKSCQDQQDFIEKLVDLEYVCDVLSSCDEEPTETLFESMFKKIQELEENRKKVQPEYVPSEKMYLEALRVGINNAYRYFVQENNFFIKNMKDFEESMPSKNMFAFYRYLKIPYKQQETTYTNEDNICSLIQKASYANENSHVGSPSNRSRIKDLSEISILSTMSLWANLRSSGYSVSTDGETDGEKVFNLLKSETFESNFISKIFPEIKKDIEEGNDLLVMSNLFNKNRNMLTNKNNMRGTISTLEKQSIAIAVGFPKYIIKEMEEIVKNKDIGIYHMDKELLSQIKKTAFYKPSFDMTEEDTKKNIDKLLSLIKNTLPIIPFIQKENRQDFEKTYKNHIIDILKHDVEETEFLIEQIQKSLEKEHQKPKM